VSGTPSPGWGKTLIFAFIPLLVFYGISETLLSAFGFEPFVALPPVTPAVRGRRLSPWGDERDVLTRVCFGQSTVFELPNYRAFLPPVAKSDEVRRVAFMGDSFVFGMGLPDDQTLPFLLGGWLHQRHPDRPVEVINFGWPGGNTTHYLQMEPKVAGYEPDRVLLGFTISNDGETGLSVHEAPPADERSAGGKEPVLPPPAPSGLFEKVRVMRDAILVHSRTLSLLYRPVRRWEARWRQDRFERQSFDDPVKWGTVESNMAAIAARFRALDVPVTVVIFPHMFPSRHVGLNDVAGYPYRLYHQRVRSLAEANGMEVFDVLELFEREGLPTFDPFIIDGDGHPNGRYTALVAAALGERLLADPRLDWAVQRPPAWAAGATPAPGLPSQRSK
jgi:hypothetical protein